MLLYFPKPQNPKTPKPHVDNVEVIIDYWLYSYSGGPLSYQRAGMPLSENVLLLERIRFLQRVR